MVVIICETQLCANNYQTINYLWEISWCTNDLDTYNSWKLKPAWLSFTLIHFPIIHGCQLLSTLFNKTYVFMFNILNFCRGVEAGLELTSNNKWLGWIITTIQLGIKFILTWIVIYDKFIIWTAIRYGLANWNPSKPVREMNP